MDLLRVNNGDVKRTFIVCLFASFVAGIYFILPIEFSKTVLSLTTIICSLSWGIWALIHPKNAFEKIENDTTKFFTRENLERIFLSERSIEIFIVVITTVNIMIAIWFKSVLIH